VKIATYLPTGSRSWTLTRLRRRRGRIGSGPALESCPARATARCSAYPAAAGTRPCCASSTLRRAPSCRADSCCPRRRAARIGWTATRSSSLAPLAKAWRPAPATRARSASGAAARTRSPHPCCSRRASRAWPPGARWTRTSQGAWSSRRSPASTTPFSGSATRAGRACGSTCPQTPQPRGTRTGSRCARARPGRSTALHTPPARCSASGCGRSSGEVAASRP
jgi:hypothetical protein